MESLRISIFESFLSGGRVGRRALKVQKAELKAWIEDIFLTMDLYHRIDSSNMNEIERRALTVQKAALKAF